MRELFVKALEGESAQGAALRCEYYVLIGQVEAEGQFVCENYGVKVTQTGAQCASAEIPAITPSISRIDALVELLTRNFVTPTALADVVADWL